MLEHEDDLPSDVSTLKRLVQDLSRRLQNAQHTIAAERRAAQIAAQQAEYYRLRLAETAQAFRLESARVQQADNKQSYAEEAQRYEESKTLGQRVHEQLRLAELDFQMQTQTHRHTPQAPIKLVRLRNQAKALEAQQTQRRETLQQFGERERLNEELVHAVQRNDLSAALSLLRCGADVNYVDAAGALPVHYACAAGHTELVQSLLDCNSDASARLTGVSPLVLAAQRGHIPVLQVLLRQSGVSIEEKGRAGVPATIAALQAAHFAAMDFLLCSNANIDTVDLYENSLLHYATRLPEEELHWLQYLLSRGASQERVNKREQTPLQMALHEGHRAAAVILGHALEDETESEMKSETERGRESVARRERPFFAGGQVSSLPLPLPLSPPSSSKRSSNKQPQAHSFSLSRSSPSLMRRNEHAHTPSETDMDAQQRLQRKAIVVNRRLKRAGEEGEEEGDEVSRNLLLGGEMEDNDLVSLNGDSNLKKNNKIKKHGNNNRSNHATRNKSDPNDHRREKEREDRRLQGGPSLISAVTFDDPALQAR